MVVKAGPAAHSHVNSTRLYIFHIQALDREWQKYLAVFKVFNDDVLFTKILTLFFWNYLAFNIL